MFAGEFNSSELASIASIASIDEYGAHTIVSDNSNMMMKIKNS